MFSLKKLDPNTIYVLDFVQFENGYRASMPRKPTEPPHPQRVFSSTEYLGSNLRRWAIEGNFSDNVLTESGERLAFETHGIWLTLEEERYITADEDIPPPLWVNGLPPQFPPK